MVTGGSGYLGTWFSRELINKGREVIAFDLSPPREGIGSPGYRFVKGDATVLSDVLDAARTHAVGSIVHLAALLSEADSSPAHAYGPNYTSTLNALEAARILGIGRVVFASSIAVYGPQTRPGAGEDEVTSLPELNYGVSKLFGELLGRIYAKNHGIDFRAGRIPFAVGRGQTHHWDRFIVDMIESAVLGRPYRVGVPGDTRVQIAYVKDVVSALLSILEARSAPSRVYNVAGFSVTIAEVVAEVKRRRPGADIDFGETSELPKIGWMFPPELSGELIQRELGWTRKYDLSAMVEDLIHDIKNSPKEVLG